MEFSTEVQRDDENRSTQVQVSVNGQWVGLQSIDPAHPKQGRLER